MLSRAIAQIRWFLAQIVAQFRAHGLLDSAAALTYTTLFAVVPLMTVSYAILSIFPTFATIAGEIQTFIFENFLPSSSTVVQEHLADFAYQARQLTVAGFAILLVTAFLMLVTMEKAFNEIWQVAEPRKGMQRFLTYWGVLTFGPPLVVVGLLVSSYLFSLPVVSDIDPHELRKSLLGYLPPLLSTAGFTVLFFAVPNCRVQFRHALAGGLLTMVFFESAKRLFSEIVANLNMQVVYGAFAAVPLFLTWLYLVWMLVLSGAIVVRTLGLERVDAPDDDAPMLVQCVRLLAFLQQAHRAGRIVRRVDLNARVKMSGEERVRVLGALDELKLVVSGGGDRIMLGRDLRGVTLLDLYQRLPFGLDLARLAEVHDLPRLTEPLVAYARFGAEHLAVDLDAVVSDGAAGPVA
jgi:membrane protein